MSEFSRRLKRYTAIKNRLALAEPLTALLFLALIQVSGISAYMKGVAANHFTSRYGIAAAYAVLFGAIYYALTFFLHFYRTYAVEREFGLSNQSLPDWIKDEVKKLILGLALFLLFILFLYYLIETSPDGWWLLAAAGWVLFTVVFAEFAPVLILPLFFKFERLNDEGFKEKIAALAAGCGIKILDIYKLKMSAKTNKANAALAGIGKTRRVLLGDTLLEKYTRDEVEVVLAHELAHHKLGHMRKLISLAGLCSLAAFYAAKIFIGGAADITLFPSLAFVFSLAGLLLSPLQNAFSRRLESAADRLALDLTKLPGAFISCMDKLAKQNMSDPSPGRFIEIMLYDHPPISKRIEMARKFKT